MKLNIHFVGTIKKEVGGYNYLHELGFKSVLWKTYEITWKKFKDFSKAEGFVAMLILIWYKEASENMKNVNYVFEDINGDISKMCSSARIACVTDVFLENEDESGYAAEGEEGDETMKLMHMRNHLTMAMNQMMVSRQQKMMRMRNLRMKLIYI
ncbi:hypothetical protein N665_0092s0022 [Sinapis alba]|nr:hypothetical protein N665_0092s0022 [Sinapis alba]